MPKSATTVANWVTSSFLEHRQHVKMLLANAISSIHISFDLWTSPNNMSLIEIVGYWLNQSGSLHH
ncbi:MAG TPA: hypothetical protein VEP90_04695 [Methylomirabilota bacterium]|nr:hypothetical protein [Methylomirabilota bacterium]